MNDDQNKVDHEAPPISEPVQPEPFEVLYAHCLEMKRTSLYAPSSVLVPDTSKENLMGHPDQLLLWARSLTGALYRQGLEVTDPIIVRSIAAANGVVKAMQRELYS